MFACILRRPVLRMGVRRVCPPGSQQNILGKLTPFPASQQNMLGELTPLMSSTLLCSMMTCRVKTSPFAWSCKMVSLIAL